MSRFKLLAIILFAILIGTGCDSTTNEPEEEVLNLAEFKGLVGTSPNSGLYEELEGSAQYEIESSDTTFSFILYSSLISDSSVTEIILSTKSLEVPSAGTYDFNDIDGTSQIFSSGFSGFYLSPNVGLNKQYYTESGILTIELPESGIGIKGSFEAVIFSKASTGSGTYTRQYSQIEGEFFASPKN